MMQTIAAAFPSRSEAKRAELRLRAAVGPAAVVRVADLALYEPDGIKPAAITAITAPDPAAGVARGVLQEAGGQIVAETIVSDDAVETRPI